MKRLGSPVLLAAVGSVLGGLILWTVVVDSGLISTRFTPTPFEILQEFNVLFDKGYVGVPIYDHIAASLVRTLIGFSAAAVVGIPFGLLVGRVKFLEAAFMPWFAFLRPIPAIAFVPLVIATRSARSWPARWIAIYRVADGKLAEHWQHIDELGLRQQLGATLSVAAG
jgi:ABC-type nitrate/sulfonate/bicarbonate transport system permease component